MQKINVLGTTYTVKELPDKQVAEEMHGTLGEYGGYCNSYSKEIIICKNDMCAENEKVKGELQSEALRHELVHAFLNESGLKANSNWATNEEIVDWVAIQVPKMAAIMSKLGVL